MDCSPSTSRKGRPPRLARNDCHTCTEQRRKCDRARPRCENCQRSGKICGGFATQISWQPGFSTHKKPTKRSITRRPRWEPSGDTLRPRQLRFINEWPGKVTPNLNESADTTIIPQPSTRTVHSVEHDLLLIQPGTVNPSPCRFPSPLLHSILPKGGSAWL